MSCLINNFPNHQWVKGLNAKQQKRFDEAVAISNAKRAAVALEGRRVWHFIFACHEPECEWCKDPVTIAKRKEFMYGKAA